MEFVEKRELYPDLREVQGPPEPETMVDGKKVLMFTSNNYLGLSTHPKVTHAAEEAIKKYGVGSDGSRLLSGNLDIHRKFEKAIADFKGGEDAIVWPSGYAANVGCISAVMNTLKIGASDFLSFKGVVLSDELNHASIIDGIKLSKQKAVIYKHCDVADLERKLRRHRWRRKMVVTDSVFSMDGDIAPLPAISQLCKKYDALLMIDEAHASGVLGEHGHGSLEHFNLKAGRDVDIVLGTCSKALAATGGFVVADKHLVNYLRVASRSYMFSTAMSPAASAALIEVLRVIDEEPERRKQLHLNAAYVREEFQRMGFDTCGSQTQIIPILIGTDQNAISFSRKLFERGIFAPAIRWPAVAKGKARIRLTIMSTHTTKQLDHLLESSRAIAKELRIL